MCCLRPFLRTVAVLLLLSTSAVSAQSASSGDVLKAALPNGLRVVIVRNALAPMVSVRLAYLAGSTSASADFPGTAHALEHMMFRGTSGLSSDQFDRIGLAIGGNWNAFTQNDTTQYVSAVAPADLKVVLHIEADRMRSLTLAPDQWARERGAIEQEVSRDRSSSVFRAFEQLNSALYAGTPYAWSALGTRQSFDATDTTRLRAFYDTWYTPNNAVLFLVGDVDPKATLATVAAEFASVPSRPLPQRPAITFAPLMPQTLTAPTDSANGTVSLSWRMPGIQTADGPALIIMADAISNARSALGALGIDGKSLGTSFSYSGHAAIGSATAAINYPRGADPTAYLTRLKAVLAEFRTHGVSADLVNSAIRAHIKSAAFARNSIAGLAEDWSGAVLDWDVPDPETYTRAFAAVTPAQANALAARLLDPDQAITQTWVPTGQIAPEQDVGRQESFGTKTPPDVALPAWAQSVLALPPLPHWAVPQHVFTLANGITLIVRPDHRTNTILMFGAIRINSDLEVTRDKEGVFSLTNSLMDYGTAARDRVETERALDKIGSSAWFGKSFGLTALTADFTPTLALLADTELHPTFREAELQTLREKLAVSRAGYLQTSGYAFMHAVNLAILPKDDPVLADSTPQSIRALTRPDVETFFKKAYRPDMTTIEIIGDIEPDTAKAAIEGAFGAWHANGPKPDVVLPPIPSPPVTTLQMDGAGRAQDAVLLYQPLGLHIGAHENLRDLAAFSLENAVLSGGFTSRLYKALRRDAGLVYGVSSSPSIDRTRSVFTITFGADPSKVAQAEAITSATLYDLRASPVPTAELLPIKAAYLRTQPFAAASLSSIAGIDLSLATSDQPLDQPNRLTAAIAATTPADMQRVFAREVDQEKFLTFIFGPKPPAALPVLMSTKK